jgi:predicted SprT family Zn-dependent metalloprotease
MTHDDTKSARDVRFRMAGIGMAHTFKCGRCEQPRSTQGRKLEKVKGLRQYVCQGCVKGPSR